MSTREKGDQSCFFILKDQPRSGEEDPLVELEGITIGHPGQEVTYAPLQSVIELLPPQLSEEEIHVRGEPLVKLNEDL